ncbi:MAG: EscU/YscU/HrcU family type III secretion system export apparatus switch protein [Fimbriimonadaceae bacterium]|nr:EscU/YscU/HrcU family type III secretion system export apparatus switch protein [Fimbriimonadaceae bacterium]
MADNASAQERTEEATPRRKQEARKKGTVARSTDLNGALAMLTLAMLGPGVAAKLAEAILTSIQSNVAKMPREISPATVIIQTQSMAVPALSAAMPLALGLCAVGLASNFSQVGFVLSGEPLKPSFDKVNPLTGFKRLFSRRAVVEGLKAVAKMCLFSWIAYVVLQQDWDKLLGIGGMAPAVAAGVLGEVVHKLVMRIAVVWLVIAGFDYFFQRKEVDKQIKMTKDELKREMREQEGSPEVKQAQYQRRRKLLKGGMVAKLKEADVLITNPTHFAVAIKYERSQMHAPVVLAKGQDLMALRMRELAADLRLPTVENKPLARALYAQCEAGDFVPRDLFGPVAEVLAYVYKSTQRTKK